MQKTLMLATLLTLAVCASPAHAITNADYDNRNGVSLGDTPYRSAAQFAQTVEYNSASFTADEEYGAGPNTYAACDGKGARSGWFRFTTAAAGNVNVAVDSSAAPYDVIYSVYTAPASTVPGTAAIGQLTQVDCVNSNKGTPNETYTFGHEIGAGQVIYVQTLSVCANRLSEFPVCDANERNAALGGPTKVAFRFTPANTGDSDGVPNSLDACPNENGVTEGRPSNGCPDADGDGVTEPGDACPGVPGFDGTGCRKPDHDGDNYVAANRPGGDDCNDDNPAISPAAAEIPGNAVDENCDGKDFKDADKDNYDDAVAAEDCNPGDIFINRAAPEIRGNKVDENCDGVNSPFPRLQNEISTRTWALKNGTVVGFRGFKIADAEAKLRVRVACSAKRNCPFAGKTYRAKKATRAFTVGREFARKRRRIRVLKPGSQVTVSLTLPGHVGKAVRYTLRKRGKQKTLLLCSEEGSRALRKSCTGTS